MKALLNVLLVGGAWAWVVISYNQRPASSPALSTPTPKNYAAPALEPATQRTKQLVGLAGRHDGSGSPTFVERVQLGSNEARKFDVTIAHAANGSLLGAACFYDIDPAVTTVPERLSPDKRHWTQAGTIMVHGAPADLIDGATWTGWLVRDGVSTFSDSRGAEHTVAAYRVTSEPEFKAAPAATWQDISGHTALDQKARR